MDLEQQGRIWGNGVFIISRMGTVGGADFPEDTAALGHDIGNPEGTADLHQFTPGNHHLFAPGQGFQADQHGTGIVVDHHGTFGPADFAKDIFHVAVP